MGRRRRSDAAVLSAVAAAVRHFEATTGRTAHPGVGDVIGEEERGVVVRICHGDTRPPRRAWYLVGVDGSVLDELSFEEAARFGERPWR